MTMSFVAQEIASQPDCWRQAVVQAPRDASLLPAAGERVAVIGCGTSWYMAMCYAALRESLGLGWTDAFSAPELPQDRGYDRVVAITRSGTTTEVLEALARLRGHTPTVAITGDLATPITAAADAVVALEFADERSVVQTRFATTALALLRVSLGHDLSRAIADAEAALAMPIDAYLRATQVTFLGKGWTTGLACEAALKMREAAQMWTEAYSATEYRHGPVSVAEAGRATWMLGAAQPGLADDVRGAGAAFVSHPGLDPMAALIVAQRTAVGIALLRGLDPDHPRGLTRSVILDAAGVPVSERS
jgi:fructoselysine-6-P-deglycase FrlB-like protein